jgi:hypothetical protein
VTTVQEVITRLDIERELATRNFEDFLDFVQILEPPPGRGVIKFEKWPHLVDTIDILGTERLMVILKARQVGISWLLAAYALWTAIYHRGAVVLELSQTEKVATALLGKCKTILSLLPTHLQTSIGQDSLTEITFPDMQSKITALPSTESAGRSETATLVIQDEADYHLYLEANYAAVKPTIDAGGQLIMASTSNKKVSTSLFKELYRGSPDNGWIAQFIGWNARPGRDGEWLQRIRDNVPATSDMNPELYMEQEYPSTADEALAPSRVLSAFDPDVLKLMQDDVRTRIGTLGSASIYQRYTVGKKYAAGTDTSHGTGGDNAVTVIVDIMTGYVVADIHSSVMSPEELAFQSVQLLEAYQNPVWAIEDNDWGIITIRKAEELEYKQLYERANDKVGWHTDERTRTVLWGDLIEAINSHLLVVPSADGLSQFVSVIRNPDKGGRIEAMSGTHDDYPMAVGIAWQMRNKAWNDSNKTLIHKFD